MLFLLNDGVPSVARWVRLDAGAPDVPVVPPDPPRDPRPGSQPGPDPGPDEPGGRPDLTAPSLELGFAERRWLRRLRRTGRLRVKVTVDEPATVHLKLRRGKRRVARASVETNTDRIVHLRPRKGTLRWLRHAKSPRLRFSAVATDAAGNDSAWARVLRR